MGPKGRKEGYERLQRHFWGISPGTKWRRDGEVMRLLWAQGRGKGWGHERERAGKRKGPGDERRNGGGQRAGRRKVKACYARGIIERGRESDLGIANVLEQASCLQNAHGPFIYIV